ncbi:MAG TPA: hypothetical protein VMV62_00940 [Candidatus Paceibacterota bacterium]|nr:hypothetical protein [Candidatus Paceibacterota bacterium]
MRSFSAAKDSAERTGTDKSRKFRSAARKFIRGATAVVLLLASTYLMQQHEFEKAASVQKAGKPAAQASIDCTVYAPCTPHEKPDGSTEKAFVPRGKNVCFDNSFWENITRLGERISYQGGPEEEYRCTREEVLSGACGTRVFDTFRFTPEKGVRPPRYWFIGEQQHEC